MIFILRVCGSLEKYYVGVNCLVFELYVSFVGVLIIESKLKEEFYFEELNVFSVLIVNWFFDLCIWLLCIRIKNKKVE